MIINLRGGKTAEVDFGHVHSRHLTITGAHLRPRSIAEKSSICRAPEERIWPLIADGSISTVTFATFPFAQAAAAHRLMESSPHIGKIILTARGDPETAHRPQTPAPAHQGDSA